MTPYQIINGDSRVEIAKLPHKSINCVVTSPPYWGLRDYGTATWIGGDVNCSHKPSDTPKQRGIASSTLKGGKEHTGHKQEGYNNICPKCGAKREDLQLGQEDTPEEYIQALVEIFRPLKDVLTDDGTIWLNLGDTYWGGKGKSGQSMSAEAQEARRNSGQSFNGHEHQTGGVGHILPQDRKHEIFKPKDLIGIPWRVAMALQADGWYLRQDIIWHKPNPMPESVLDRCTKSHEYIFLLTKSATYYYNSEAIKEPGKNPADDLRRKEAQKETNKSFPSPHKNGLRSSGDKTHKHVEAYNNGDEAHRRSAGLVVISDKKI